MAQPFTQFRKDINRLYDRPRDLQVYVYLRNEANYEDSFFKSGGFPVRKDEVVRSLKTIAKATGLSESSVRNAICNLKNAGFITKSAHGKFSLFSTACEFTGKRKPTKYPPRYLPDSPPGKYNNIR